MNKIIRVSPMGDKGLLEDRLENLEAEIRALRAEATGSNSTLLSKNINQNLWLSENISNELSLGGARFPTGQTDSSKVICLLLRVRKDRIEYMNQLYAGFYMKLLIYYVHPDCGLMKSRHPNVTILCSMGHKYETNILEHLSLFEASYPDAQGLLIHHMDFWVHPRSAAVFARGFAQDLVVAQQHDTPIPKGRGYGHRCLTRAALVEEWVRPHWHWTEKARVQALSDVIAVEKAFNISEAIDVCFNWIDLMYYPRGVW
eukprot:CAMPEP_0167799548 /NCGR_PEP_ID=MMETSP0111_2-20121227/17101_1 /TAXON_ID=91324 /ORGANISM="Lotharella globosa, Strain CCCM811" /LENGTH=257 /DNA_ID=CAMNT_0007694437 /DNA_START=35 /DNA_END=806 /DNA_ORIENTATION=-